jgi:hypothetical protein
VVVVLSGGDSAEQQTRHHGRGPDRGLFRVRVKVENAIELLDQNNQTARSQFHEAAGGDLHVEKNYARGSRILFR